jgi:DNA-binding response OmpR family regulator
MKKILIVEDDQIVANIYRNKFTVEGYKVEVAFDGETGLQTLRNFQPDAIIMDLMLPKLTGVELMRKIRAEPAFQQTPVIVFSNTYLTNMVQEAWKAGATKCLSKANCSPRQVIEVIRSTLFPNGASAATAAAQAPAKAPVPAQNGHPAISSAEADANFQEDLRRSMLEGLAPTLAGLRAELKGLAKAENEAARLKYLQEMYRRIRALTGNAGVAGLTLIAQMCDAFEVLLKELHDKPSQLNPSTLRTVANTVDFLAILFERGTAPDKQQLPPAKVLVVDDEAISRRAVTYALDKAKLKSTSIEDPRIAFNMLSEQKFDLVFLDVDMPEMNGFELCTKLRTLPAHKRTPVVFVTSLTDFESRANSTMSGGNDFIAKPFMFIELAVKALLYVLRPRLVAAPEPALVKA